MPESAFGILQSLLARLDELLLIGSQTNSDNHNELGLSLSRAIGKEGCGLVNGNKISIMTAATSTHNGSNSKLKCDDAGSGGGTNGF